MSRSAAGVDYRPFQVFQKLVLSRSRELYYIGGSDVLPAPLEPKREAYVISRLKTDQEQEARSLLIEHNLRLVVYIARKFDNTGVGVEDLILDRDDRSDQGYQYIQPGKEYQTGDICITLY